MHKKHRWAETTAISGLQDCFVWLSSCLTICQNHQHGSDSRLIAGWFSQKTDKPLKGWVPLIAIKVPLGLETGRASIQVRALKNRCTAYTDVALRLWNIPTTHIKTSLSKAHSEKWRLHYLSFIEIFHANTVYSCSQITGSVCLEQEDKDNAMYVNILKV